MTFGVTPVAASTVVGTAVPGFIQWQGNAANVGTPSVVTVNIESPLIATRGVGEQRNVLTISADVCLDGPTWTQFTLPITLTGWGGMAYDSVHKRWITGGWLNGTYGTAMYAVSSADGKNWPGPMIELTSANNSGAGMSVVACVNGVTLVAAGDTYDAYYSSDGGLTWTQATGVALTIGNTPAAQGVASSTGRIFMPTGGLDGAVNYLPYFDVGAKTFGHIIMPATASWWLTGGDGISKVMAVSPSGATAYSADGGLTWTAGATLPTIQGSGDITRLVYGAGYWLVTADQASNEMAWSNDNGASWHVFTVPSSARYYTALYAQLVFLVISGLGGPSSSGNTYALTGMTPAALAEAVNAPPGQNNLNWIFLTDTDYAGHYSAVGFTNTNIGFYGVC